MTILILLALLFALVIPLVRFGGRFPAVARAYLGVAPFMALVSLFNHNFDADTYEHWVRMVPLWIATLLLAFLGICADRRDWRMSFEGIALGAYFIVTFCGVPFSVDPGWSVTTWSWSVPGLVLFHLAGLRTSSQDLKRESFAWLAVIGFLLINLSLIGYGLLTGRADDVFYTRNFGSVYASTSMLVFLSLYIGMAWLQAEKSGPLGSGLLVLSAVAIVGTLSRTALVMPVLFAALLVGSRGRARGAMAGIILVAGVAIFAVVSLGSSENAFEASLVESLTETWRGRLTWEDVESARQVRVDEFAGIRETVAHALPWPGAGFGGFLDFSIYADAHNLLLTEAFENSKVAALLLVFAAGIPVIARGMLTRDLRPIASSAIAFLVIAHSSGAVLSYRAFDSYYAAYPGWAYFFLIGYLRAGVEGWRESSSVVSGARGTPIADESRQGLMG